jgi:quinohemoprotein ethanol dehydrogenase
MSGSRFLDRYLRALLPWMLLGWSTLWHPASVAADGPIVAPPPSRAAPHVIARGAALYAKRCARCHGAQARGGTQELRWLSPQRHARFFAVVLGGSDAAKGMPSFADVLTHDEAAAIHAYIIRRANEDWPAASK